MTALCFRRRSTDVVCMILSVGFLESISVSYKYKKAYCHLTVHNTTCIHVGTYLAFSPIRTAFFSTDVSHDERLKLSPLCFLCKLLSANSHCYDQVLKILHRPTMILYDFPFLVKK